ncbi:hypothetical protein KAR91_04655 [Candidatus Pacearchaeota archaeon]|nr:hypothetical protein [Candidatus Pacearchaeota archaeon]
MRPISDERMKRMEKNNPRVYKRLITCLDLRDKEQTLKDAWLAETGSEWRLEG